MKSFHYIKSYDGFLVDVRGSRLASVPGVYSLDEGALYPSKEDLLRLLVIPSLILAPILLRRFPSKPVQPVDGITWPFLSPPTPSACGSPAELILDEGPFQPAA